MRSQVCSPGYASTHRHVTAATKRKVFAEYGIQQASGTYEIDHLVSLEVGGSNSIRNLWPESYAGLWGARRKDRLENRLHSLVCAGKLALHEAQRTEESNWIAAYHRYFH
ncbi:MAG: HNH endonuclease [Solirubrobacteraceae bacterium]